MMTVKIILLISIFFINLKLYLDLSDLNIPTKLENDDIISMDGNYLFKNNNNNI
jgi:hypothetical protein